MAANLTPGSDDVKANRTTTSAADVLTHGGRGVLADWYARDYEFLALCRELTVDD